MRPTNYWKIVYYTSQEEYETSEIIITDEEYRKVQKALSEGADLLLLSGRPTIRRSSIANISSANDIVSDIQRVGLSVPGLEAPAGAPRLSEPHGREFKKLL